MAIPNPMPIPNPIPTPVPILVGRCRGRYRRSGL
jgi:hypothetical protein